MTKEYFMRYSLYSKGTVDLVHIDNPRSLLHARCLMWRKTRMEEGERTTVNFGFGWIWGEKEREIWEWDRANVAHTEYVYAPLPIVSFTDGHVPLRSPFPFPLPPFTLRCVV